MKWIKEHENIILLWMLAIAIGTFFVTVVYFIAVDLFLYKGV